MAVAARSSVAMPLGRHTMTTAVLGTVILLRDAGVWPRGSTRCGGARGSEGGEDERSRRGMRAMPQEAGARSARAKDCAGGVSGRDADGRGRPTGQIGGWAVATAVVGDCAGWMCL